jgi:hypothetical protein
MESNIKDELGNTVTHDRAEELCRLESVLTNITGELATNGFPTLAENIEEQLGDLQSIIRSAGFELGGY